MTDHELALGYAVGGLLGVIALAALMIYGYLERHDRDRGDE